MVTFKLIFPDSLKLHNLRKKIQDSGYYFSCQPFSIPLYHYATMPLCHYATMPLCHYATMPLCYATMPLCHYATMPLCHYATMPLCHYATMPLCHYATMPLCHYATMPLCHYATMPLCHYATIPLYHYTTFWFKFKGPNVNRFFNKMAFGRFWGVVERVTDLNGMYRRTKMSITPSHHRRSH